MSKGKIPKIYSNKHGPWTFCFLDQHFVLKPEVFFTLRWQFSMPDPLETPESLILNSFFFPDHASMTTENMFHAALKKICSQCFCENQISRTFWYNWFFISLVLSSQDIFLSHEAAWGRGLRLWARSGGLISSPIHLIIIWEAWKQRWWWLEIWKGTRQQKPIHPRDLRAEDLASKLGLKDLGQRASSEPQWVGASWREPQRELKSSERNATFFAFCFLVQRIWKDLKQLRMTLQKSSFHADFEIFWPILIST